MRYPDAVARANRKQHSAEVLTEIYALKKHPELRAAVNEQGEIDILRTNGSLSENDKALTLGILRELELGDLTLAVGLRFPKRHETHITFCDGRLCDAIDSDTFYDALKKYRQSANAALHPNDARFRRSSAKRPEMSLGLGNT